MVQEEVRVSGETIFDGVIIKVKRDRARLMDGRIVNREVVEHPGGVAVFAIDENDCVIMVRQYRYPMGEETLELPAGKLEPGEEPASAAMRELEEETGMTPGEFLYMGCSYSSPGIITEKIYLYFARNLSQGNAHPDDGEFLDVTRIPLQELLNMAEDNRLVDGKTLIGLYKGSMLLYKEKLKQQGGGTR